MTDDVELYDPGKHLETLQQWCIGHDKRPFPDWWLPPTGFVVPGVIAAFLYATNSGLAFVECVISNPNSTHAERQAGLDRIDAAITAYCRAHNIRAVQGQTSFVSIAEASKRNGWHVLKPAYKILIKTFGDNIE